MSWKISICRDRTYIDEETESKGTTTTTTITVTKTTWCESENLGELRCACQMSDQEIKTTENFRISRIYPDRRILWWIFLNKYHINLLWSHQLFSKKKTFRSKNVNIPTTSAWSSISCETWFTCTAERPIRICTISVWRTWTGIRRTFVDIYVK